MSDDDYDFDVEFEPDLMILGLVCESAELVDGDGKPIPPSTWTDEDIAMGGELFVAYLINEREKARMH